MWLISQIIFFLWDWHIAIVCVHLETKKVNFTNFLDFLIFLPKREKTLVKMEQFLNKISLNNCFLIVFSYFSTPEYLGENMFLYKNLQFQYEKTVPLLMMENENIWKLAKIVLLRPYLECLVTFPLTRGSNELV